MTTCSGTPAEEYAELYIQGALPEFEAERFEEHYFDCPVCLAQLEALQAVGQELARHPIAAPQAAKAPKTPIAPLTWPKAVRIWGAVAAVLLIGYMGYRLQTGRKTPSPVAVTSPKAAPPTTAPGDPAMVAIADLALPQFRASTLRGEGENLRFEAGMRAYASGDCAGAVADLSKVPERDPEARAALLFSGVCQMHEGKLAAGAASLRRIANAGDSPQQEAALYYLAQISLAANDPASSRSYLAKVVALHGDFEKRARTELGKLPSVPPAK